MFHLGELFIARGSRRRSISSSVAAVVSIERLEERVALSATAVSAGFNARNDFGLTEINVDGQNLLVGNGFHIIGGQKHNLDVASNQINSEHPSSKNGIMYLGGDRNNTAVPYDLTFTKSNDKSKLGFSVTVGASIKDFSTISIPLEAKLQHFEYWRASTDTRLHRFDNNPVDPNYVGGVGSYAISSAPAGGNGAWGEIIGPKYTIRVTISNPSQSMTPFFVNAPGLATGVRDVEFSFGTVRANTTATVQGTIQVFRTDQALLPQSPKPPSQGALVFQAESQLSHQIGRRDGDGWSVNVRDTPNRYLSYGPYTRDVAAGNRTATFRLQLDNVTADNNRILTIDVYDADTGKILAKRELKRRDFSRAFEYKDFSLNFNAVAGHRLEFRTFWHGGSYAKQDWVTVR